MSALQVPIVVIAEDDVTSNQYVVTLLRQQSAAGAAPQAAVSSFLPSSNSNQQVRMVAVDPISLCTMPPHKHQGKTPVYTNGVSKSSDCDCKP